MNDKLFKAILSMDAYNRGYDRGIKLPTVLNTTQIGNATIVSQIDIPEGGAAQSIGFYALAYNYNGEKIISYRGTDDVDGFMDMIPLPYNKDVYHGWSLGSGNIESEQAHMAINFYKEVAGAGNLKTANISLTGHSLGGGLAGLVANDNVYILKVVA